MSEQQTLAAYGEDQQESSVPESDRYKNPDWLRERYVEDRMTTVDIADECEVSHNTIGYWLDKHGIDIRSISESRLPKEVREKLQDEEWMRDKYVKKRRTTPDIADELDVTDATVGRWLRNHDIEVRGNSESKLPKESVDRLHSKNWLHDQYIEQRQSTLDIADELNVSTTAVSKWLQKHGIELRGNSESQIPEEVREKLRDGEWMRQQYVEQRRSTPEIANELNIPKKPVCYWLKKHGIELRGSAESRLPEGAIEKLRDGEWLREQYIEQRRTTCDIADELNVSATTVSKCSQEHDIEVRGYSEARLPDGVIEKLSDEEWLREQYIEQRRSTPDIADELNVSYRPVTTWLQKHDIEVRGGSEAQLPEGVKEKLSDEEWMREQYVEQHRSTVKIAGELNISANAVWNWLQKHGIEVRGISESHLPEDVREKLRDEAWLREQYVEQHQSIYEIASEIDTSATAVSTWLANHGIDTRSGIQNPEHLDHKVRSGWELEIANLLSKNDIQYEYESITISWGDDHVYTPDFITEKYVIEIKGRLYRPEGVVQKAEAAVDALDGRDYVIVSQDHIAQQIPHDIHISWENREKLIDLLKDD